MKKYIISFLHRGSIFGGFGPIITGIILGIISLFDEVILVDSEIFIVIISTYLLAFVHAGSSVFNQIEEWPLPKSLAAHFGSLYCVYVLCYLLNRWIPFNWIDILFFTLIFVAVYLVVWFIVYIIIKNTTIQMNKQQKLISPKIPTNKQLQEI